MDNARSLKHLGSLPALSAFNATVASSTLSRTNVVLACSLDLQCAAANGQRYGYGVHSRVGGITSQPAGNCLIAFNSVDYDNFYDSYGVYVTPDLPSPSRIGAFTGECTLPQVGRRRLLLTEVTSASGTAS